MTEKCRGAAIRQETRAQGSPAVCRQPRESIAERRGAGELTPKEFAVSCVVGTLFVFSFMWLAAAY